MSIPDRRPFWLRRRTAPAKDIMKRIHRTLGLAIGIIATAAVVWYAAQAMRGQDLSSYTSVRSLLGIAAATFFYTSIIPVSALAWRFLLRGMGVERPWRELVEIMAITQIAKYMPGNVGVHLGRAGMSIAKGIPSRPLVVSMLIETALAVGAALVIGLAGIALSSLGSSALVAELRDPLWISGLVLAAVTVAVVVFRYVARPLLQRIAPRHAGLLATGPTPTTPVLARTFSAYAVNYVFIGVGLTAMAHVMLPNVAHEPALLCASFALAWVAGFFTPGAPAGLGVREGLMLVILGTSYASADALALTIAFRLATMLGDIILFLAGYALLLRPRKHAPIASPTK